VPPRTSVVANECLRIWARGHRAEPRALGDSGDDVVGAPGAEAVAPLVEKERWAVARAGPVGALSKPVDERFAWLPVDGNLADALPLAEDAERAFTAESRTSSTSSATVSAILAPA
jgi:hypothetical protein